MAHFYGTLETGDKRTQQVTRCGNKSEGMFATIYTPNGGICVVVNHNSSTGEDHWHIEHEKNRDNQGTCGIINGGVIGKKA